MRQETNPTDIARNHWRYILEQIGVPPTALTGRHTECPACGGRDRFRFDNKEGAGTFYCSGCGAGTGYNLVMRMKDVDFPGALEIVKGIVKPELPQDVTPAVMTMPERRASLNRVWSAGRPGAEETEQYLIGRGLSKEVASMAARSLRYTDGAWLRETSSFSPAILALVTRLSGQPVSIHRTFLLSDGLRSKKMMPPVGDLCGAGVWFGSRLSHTWIVGEGIESTLAGMQSEYGKGLCVGGQGTGVAALNAYGLEHLEVPGHVRNLVILADNDASFTGMKAAAALAHRVAMRKGQCEITIATPAFTGKDALDTLGVENGPVYHLCGGRREP